jgi:putative transposase
MHGISTRSYKKVLPEMAETVGVSKSNVSREFIEASEQQMKEFAERKFDDKDILIIYIDGIRFSQFHVIAAVGVDSEGFKHVLGLTEGATENTTIVKDLLEDVVARGLDPNRKRLFVIDGSKALRNAVNVVFGDNPVQHCRKHKVSNVMDHLPKELKDQVKSVMKAAWRLEPEEGKKRIRQQARQLEIKYPSAASSLLEGLDEMFNSKLRDELLNRELFLHIDELRCVADRWRMDYNHYRPHSSLDYTAPAAFAVMCLEQSCATLRLPQDKENMCRILS